MDTAEFTRLSTRLFNIANKWNIEFYQLILSVCNVHTAVLGLVYV